MIDQLQTGTDSSIIQAKSKKPPFMNLWSILLLVYLLLFISTAFLAFGNIEIVSPEDYQKYGDISDPETKFVALEILKVEDAERSNRNMLATQSFNVVLGALLGFLSATFAPLVQHRKEKLLKNIET